MDGDHILGLSSQAAALAGYPLISVPAGFSFDLPVGITFMGTAFSETKLIALAYAKNGRARFGNVRLSVRRSGSRSSLQSA